MGDASEYGRRVRARREARGWTQAELARGAGVSVRTVGRAEAGSCPRALTTKARIAAALGFELGGPTEAPSSGQESSPHCTAVLVTTGAALLAALAGASLRGVLADLPADEIAVLLENVREVAEAAGDAPDASEADLERDARLGSTTLALLFGKGWLVFVRRQLSAGRVAAVVEVRRSESLEWQ